MTSLILDSEAFSQLARARQGQPPGAVHAALKAAVEQRIDVLVPSAVLAEQYRGGHHDQIVDACLGRHTGIQVANTTQPLARRIGNILTRADRGSADHVDATVLAVAISAGGAVIATGDPSDIETLSSGLVGITIEHI